MATNNQTNQTKKAYVPPTSKVIRMRPDGATCQTVPVYYSTAGPGIAGAKQGAFMEEEEMNDNVWENAFMEQKD